MPDTILESAEKKVASLGTKTASQLAPMPDNGDTKEVVKDNVSEVKVVPEVKSEDKTESAKEGEGEKVAESVDVKSNITDEQVKEFLKSKGVDIEDVNSAIEKLKPKPTKTEVELAQKEKDTQRLQLFLKNGGTAEDFVAIKKMAEGGSEQSLSSLKEDLKADGFNDEEIQQIIDESYYQGLSTDSDEDSDEDEIAFNKKLKEYGKKRLDSYSSTQVDKAKYILDALDAAIESERSDKALEEKTLSMVDDYFKNFNRNLTFEIGDIDGETVSPVDYKVSDADISEVKSMLTDREKREKLLFNSDGELNVGFLADLLLQQKTRKSAIKTAFFEGNHRSVEKYHSVFPNNPYMVGVGGGVKESVAKTAMKTGTVRRGSLSTTQN